MGLAADVAVAEREGSPVVCVEAGCWHGGGAHARRARRASGNVRAAMNATDECR
jgi:hypothetical protein